MHASEKYAKHEQTIHDIYNVLHHYSQMPHGAKKLFFTSNHDENSWNGTEYEKYGKNAMAWAVFCFTWRGMPLIYSGQETANNKRLKFFDKDEIDWQKPLPLQGFYTTLCSLHKTNAVSKGETLNLPTNQNYVMAFLRKYNTEIVLVILNLSNHDRVVVEVNNEAVMGLFENVFSGLTYNFTNKQKFELMANDYLVYKSIS
jgi:glycosidase